MKKAFFLFVAIAASFCVALPATAANKSSKKSNKEFTTQVFSAEIHCEDCSKKILNTLPYQKGVKDVKVDIDKQIVIVKYDENKYSDDKVITALSKIDIASEVCSNDGAECHSKECSSCQAPHSHH